MDVEHLISEVYKIVPIWNQAHPDHHNRYVLDRAWIAVAKELKTTREAVRTKWKYLRDTFRKEVTKIPKIHSGDSGDEFERTSSWPYFKSLLFMKDQFTPRRLKGNLQLSENDQGGCDEEISQPNDEFTEIIDYNEASASQYDDSQTTSDGDLTDAVSIASTSTPTRKISNSTNKTTPTERSHEPRHNQANKRKRPNELIGHALLNIEQQKLNYIKEKASTPIVTDEEAQFFDSLLPHVKKIEARRKLLFRSQIQQLVQEYAYGNVVPPQQPQQQPAYNNSEYLTYTSM